METALSSWKVRDVGLGLLGGGHDGLVDLIGRAFVLIVDGHVD